ncbi:MAG: Tad domain-containing protein [Deltaproteobacteria bacterium]|nr:Tad domain-containing protein [Deltaproteobacteria bacterium]
MKLISVLHRLRKDEEGQTLVLGAMFGLILALCILGTVNLGRAVYARTQLQTACDNGAYSQAAMEARVLNFTSYTNRAMVVHYASVMAATSYLTWLHYMWAFVKPTLTALSWIPYIGQVIQVVKQVFQVIMDVVDWALALMSPIISAANTVLWGLQEGAWLSVWGKRLAEQIPPEAHSGDPSQFFNQYKAIWPNLMPVANMAVFSQTRGYVTPLQSWVESAKMLINSTDNNVQAARLHMLEVANSARTPWIAYGDRYSNPSGSPLARHWRWRTPSVLGCRGDFGVVSRTEMGSYKPNGSIFSSVSARFGQIFSGSRLQIDVSCWLVNGTISLFGLSSLDGVFFQTSNITNYFGPGGDKWWAKLLGSLVGGLGIFKAMVQAGQNSAPNPDLRLFWISPYVYFVPHAAARPAGGPLSAKGLGNFAQPDVAFGLAKEALDYNAEPGASTLFGRRINVNMGGGQGTTDFSYTNADWPRLPGMPTGIQFLHKGFNSLCAAQVYYHRPGEWREMPNFFNPLWSARLMPFVESNSVAAMKLNTVPLLNQFMLH